MASPQKENGFTAIANELLEAIYSAKLNSTQYKIVLCVLRFTYGFSRKSHSLSIGFINKATGVSKRYIAAEIKALIERNILHIMREHTDTTSRVLSINKDYKTWGEGRTVVHQVKKRSTDELEQHTTDEQLFYTTDDELIIQERNTKENSKEKKTSPKSWLDNYDLSDDVKQTLRDFMDNRKAIKKPATQKAIDLIVNKLNKLANNDAEKILMLEKSIENGWAGVFELKDNERIIEKQKPVQEDDWQTTDPEYFAKCKKQMDALFKNGIIPGKGASDDA